MATIEEKQIAKAILLGMLEKNFLNYEDFPGEKTCVGLVTNTYQAILKAVSSPE